jgi:cellulose synthase/poly-beta-1,6-N-acetylglucosamine synthase-like glycosyltransferase
MDLNTVLFFLFSLTSVTYIVHLGFYLISASFYDIWQHRRLDKIEKEDKDIVRRPHVTVLVPAHNEEKVIVRCLDSIFNSTYKDFDVIVANDASTDGTRQILNLYASLHPDYNVQIIHKNVNVGKGAALNYVLRRYVEGELVMMLDADSILTPQAIECAVSYFADSTIAGVAANVQIMNEHTTLSVLQKFEHMIGYRAKKAYSLTNCEFVIGGVASTYRMDIIRSVGFYDTDTSTEDISLSMKIVALGNKAHRLVYAADVMAMTEPVESLRALFRQRYRWKYGSLQNLYKHSDLIGKNDDRYTSMLTIYRMPMAVLTEAMLFLLPFTWAYALYLTLAEKSLLLFIGAYLTVSVYMFMTLWFDEHLPFLERMYLTLYVPIAYFVFFIMDFIQIIAVTMCLLKVRNITNREVTESVWKSPDRIGGQVPMLAATNSLSIVKDEVRS